MDIITKHLVFFPTCMGVKMVFEYLAAFFNTLPAYGALGVLEPLISQLRFPLP